LYINITGKRQVIGVNIRNQSINGVEDIEELVVAEPVSFQAHSVRAKTVIRLPIAETI
jgi:hypothetical protein